MFPLSETGRFSGVHCASRPASACRSGGRHLGKFTWGSNLALVFEAVQSRPSTTFPERYDYWKQYIRSFGRGICLPDSPNWRCRENLPSSPLTHKALTVWSSPCHGPYTLTYDTVRDRHSQIATHCSLYRSHIISTNNSNGSAPQLPLRLFSGPTHGHALSPLRATHGLRHSASQDVRTHQRQTHKDNNSQVETPAVATDAPAHSRAMLPGICNATCSGEHCVSHTTEI